MSTKFKMRKNIIFWALLFLIVFLVLAYTLLPPRYIDDNGIEDSITYFAYLRFLEEDNSQFYLILDDASLIIDQEEQKQVLENEVDSLAGIQRLPLSSKAEILIPLSEEEYKKAEIKELSSWLEESESQGQVFEVYVIDGVIDRLVPLED